jgi:hypothetical protein
VRQTQVRPPKRRHLRVAPPAGLAEPTGGGWANRCRLASRAGNLQAAVKPFHCTIALRVRGGGEFVQNAKPGHYGGPEVNCTPLSDVTWVGTPNRAIHPAMNASAHAAAVVAASGNASAHLVDRTTAVKR